MKKENKKELIRNFSADMSADTFTDALAIINIRYVPAL